MLPYFPYFFFYLIIKEKLIYACSAYRDEAFIHAFCFSGIKRTFDFTSAGARQSPNAVEVKNIAFLDSEMYMFLGILESVSPLSSQFIIYIAEDP